MTSGQAPCAGIGFGVGQIEFDVNDANFGVPEPASATSENSRGLIRFKDDGWNRRCFFEGVMNNNYDDGTITVNIDFTTSATSGNVVWGVRFERNNPGGTAIDSDSYDAEKTVTATVSGTAWVIKRDAVTFTQAEMDDIAALDGYRVRLRRLDTDGGDTLANDAFVFRLILSE